MYPLLICILVWLALLVGHRLVFWAKSIFQRSSMLPSFATTALARTSVETVGGVDGVSGRASSSLTLHSASGVNGHSPGPPTQRHSSSSRTELNVLQSRIPSIIQSVLVVHAVTVTAMALLVAAASPVGHSANFIPLIIGALFVSIDLIFALFVKKHLPKAMWAMFFSFLLWPVCLFMISSTSFTNEETLSSSPHNPTTFISTFRPSFHLIELLVWTSLVFVLESLCGPAGTSSHHHHHGNRIFGRFRRLARMFAVFCLGICAVVFIVTHSGPLSWLLSLDVVFICIPVSLIWSLFLPLLRRHISMCHSLASSCEALGSLHEELSKWKRKGLDEAKLAHEVRTPLNALVSCCTLLGDTTLDATQREFLDLIMKSCSQITNNIDFALEMARLDSGRVSLKSSPFNVQELCIDALNAVRHLADRKQLELQLNCSNASVDLKGDPFRLKQALQNLLTNSIKFTQMGRVSLAATVQWDDINASTALLRIEVVDTGIGMTLEQQGKLFQPFVQASDATHEQYGGTGLGLAISRQIVDLMGGNLFIDPARTAPGTGSVFVMEVLLPTANANTGPDQSVIQLGSPTLCGTVTDDSIGRGLAARSSSGRNLTRGMSRLQPSTFELGGFPSSSSGCGGRPSASLEVFNPNGSNGFGRGLRDAVAEMLMSDDSPVSRPPDLEEEKVIGRGVGFASTSKVAISLCSPVSAAALNHQRRLAPPQLFLGNGPATTEESVAGMKDSCSSLPSNAATPSVRRLLLSPSLRPSMAVAQPPLPHSELPDSSSSQEGSIQGLRCSASSANDDRCSVLTSSESIDFNNSSLREFLTPKLSPFRVMLVDDNSLSNMMMQNLLRSIGFRFVFAASGGADALELFRTTPNILLIITDINMPGMNGIQLASQIRALGSTGLTTPSDSTTSCVISSTPASAAPTSVLPVPSPQELLAQLSPRSSQNHYPSLRPVIIGLSGAAEETMAARCYEAGMDCYLSKPVSREQLMASIASKLLGCHFPGSSSGDGSPL